MRQYLHNIKRLFFWKSFYRHNTKNDPARRKDVWDKISACSTLVVAFAGFFFTVAFYIYQNKKEARTKENELQLAKAEVMGKFIPYLTSSNESQRTLALITIRNLGFDSLFVNTADTSIASLKALYWVASSSTDSNERKLVNSALQKIVPRISNTTKFPDSLASKFELTASTAGDLGFMSYDEERNLVITDQRKGNQGPENISWRFVPLETGLYNITLNVACDDKFKVELYANISPESKADTTFFVGPTGGWEPRNLKEVVGPNVFLKQGELIRLTFHAPKKTKQRIPHFRSIKLTKLR